MQDTPGKGPLRWSLQEARLPRSSPCLREGAKEWAFASSAATCGVSAQGSLVSTPCPPQFQAHQGKQVFTKNPTVLEVLTEQAPPTPRQVPHAGQGQASHVPFFCSRVRPETGSSSPGRASVGAKAAQGTSMWQEQAPLWL